MPDPTATLACAAAALGDMPGVRVLGEFRWFSKAEAWAIALELLGPPGAGVPGRTRWYLVSDQPDGAGEVELHPAVTAGLTRTFAHQAWSGPVACDAPWTSGYICMRESSAASALLLRSEEPHAFPERAVWLVEAAQRWLDAAATGALAPPGSDLELPPLPRRGGPVVAFCEDPGRLSWWQARMGKAGPARVGVVHPNSLVAVLSLSDQEGPGTCEYPWGSALRGIATQREQDAAWITLPSLPVLPPWHVPGTWGELRALICAQLGAWSLDDLLFQVESIHDGRPHWLLVGFPIGAVIGGPPVRLHWFAARLPALADPARPPPGFRRNRRSRAHYLRAVAMPDAEPIAWAPSECWHPDALEARGVHPELYPLRALLIGAGAVGSTLSELLVRGGLRRALIYDPDTVALGNLSRHTAYFTEVGTTKAHTQAVRLSLCSPHGEVDYQAERYPPAEAEPRAAALACDLVVDATGSDRVLRALAAEARPQDTLYVSVWVGYEARRVYVYTARGRRFPLEEWHAQTEPWLERERAAVEAGGLPREALGCWSAVFPAYAEDIWLASTLAARLIVAALRAGPRGLAVYQQETCPDGLPRLQRVESPDQLTGP